MAVLERYKKVSNADYWKLKKSLITIFGPHNCRTYNCARIAKCFQLDLPDIMNIDQIPGVVELPKIKPVKKKRRKVKKPKKAREVFMPKKVSKFLNFLKKIISSGKK